MRQLLLASPQGPGGIWYLLILCISYSLGTCRLLRMYCRVMVRSAPTPSCVSGFTYNGSLMSQVLISMFVGELGT